MVRCNPKKGGCGRTFGHPQGKSWARQLCYKCDKAVNPQFYIGKQAHGTGPDKAQIPVYRSFLVVEN